MRYNATLRFPPEERLIKRKTKNFKVGGAAAPARGSAGRPAGAAAGGVATVNGLAAIGAWVEG